jgi:hypothetical protein
MSADSELPIITQALVAQPAAAIPARNMAGCGVSDVDPDLLGHRGDELVDVEDEPVAQAGRRQVQRLDQDLGVAVGQAPHDPAKPGRPLGAVDRR